jgi:hypothetical protein
LPYIPYRHIFGQATIIIPSFDGPWRSFTASLHGCVFWAFSGLGNPVALTTPKKAATESGSGSEAGSVSITETENAVDVLFSVHWSY